VNILYNIVAKFKIILIMKLLKDGTVDYHASQLEEIHEFIELFESPITSKRKGYDDESLMYKIHLGMEFFDIIGYYDLACRDDNYGKLPISIKLIAPHQLHYNGNLMNRIYLYFFEDPGLYSDDELREVDLLNVSFRLWNIKNVSRGRRLITKKDILRGMKFIKPNIEFIFRQV